MTTLFKMFGLGIAKQNLLIFGFILFSSGLFAQLDSVSVSNISFTQEIITDSTTGVTDTFDIMNVEVFIDDIDFMGEVLVTVYDQSAGFPLQMVKQSKLELETNGLISGSEATIEVIGLEPITGSYNIDVQVRNYQGGNLPLASVQY